MVYNMEHAILTKGVPILVTRKKIFMVIFLSIYLLVISLFIGNVDSSETLLYAFLTTVPIVLFYMSIFTRLFSSTFFFLMFYLMLFFVQPLYNLLVEYSYYYSVDTIRLYTFLAVIGILLFCIGNCLFSSKKTKLETVYLSKASVKKVTLLISAILALSIALCFIDAKTINILALSRTDLKNSTSLLRLIATFGFYISSILFFLVAFTSKARRRSNVFKWIVIFVTIEIIIFLLFRTRSMLVVHSASVLVGYYYSSLYGYNKRNSKVSPKFITMSLGLITFIAAISARFFRGFLQPGQSIDNFNFDLKLFIQNSIESGDIGYSTRVLQVLEYVPNKHDFLFGQSYYRFLFTVIPRSIWEDKPKNTEQLVADWIEPDIQGMSVPPGIMGDAYINFGLVGIIILAAFGAFFAVLDNRMTINNFMLWGVSATWIFHLVRGGFTNPLLIFIVLLVTIKLINYKYFTHSRQVKIE